MSGQEPFREELNHCVYKYLMESGFERTASMLVAESNIDTEEKAKKAEPGALVKLVDAAVETTEKERNRAVGKDLGKPSVFETASLLQIGLHKLINQKVFTESRNVAYLGSHGPGRAVTNCVFHPKSNKKLITTCLAMNPGVTLWNLDKSKFDWDSQSFEIDRVNIGHKNRYFVRGQTDSYVETLSAAWSNKEDIFALGDKNGYIRVFDKNANFLSKTQLKSDVMHLTWSPELSRSNLLVAVDYKANVYVYAMDLAYTGLTRAIKEYKNLKNLPLKPQFLTGVDDKFLLSSDKTVFLYDVRTPCPSKYFRVPPTERVIEFQMFGGIRNNFATISSDKIVRLWNVDQNNPLRTIQLDKELWHIRFTPDSGTMSAYGSMHQSCAQFFDVETGQLKKEITNLPMFDFLEYSPDGKYIAIGCRKGQQFVYETNNYELVRSLRVPKYNSACGGLAWSPDSEAYTVGFFDGSVRLFSMRM